jgi:electron transfer flavoprotein alpha subunit
MSGTLVVAEHISGRLRDVTRELVTAAQELPRPVLVAVIAAQPAALADSVDLEGVDEIVSVTAGSDEFENDTYQDALEALIAARQPEVVVLGFTVNSMGFAPAVAAKLGLGFASDVFGFSVEDGQVIARRSFYGAKVHADVELPAGVPALLLLRPTAWAPTDTAGTASRSELTVTARAPRARHVQFVEAPISDVDITAADFLVSIGRGIGERENIERFQRLAEKMGATLSVSRPIVDSGWMPSARQVGQSGKTVKPKVYLAFGISGAVQHLAGMKTSGTIIAVNTDPEAAIFGVAHYGAVVDLFDVADELEKLY